MLMIDPPPRAAIFGASAATRKNGALTLIWNSASNAASSVSAVAPMEATPAQLTRTSISAASSATRPTSDISEKFAAMNCASCPSADLLHGARAAGLIAAGDDHRRALLGHRQCGGETHPGGASGDQRPFVLQIHGTHKPFLSERTVAKMAYMIQSLDLDIRAQGRL